MKLQLSIDMLSLEQALHLALDVAPFVDIIEVGSLLIKQEGMKAVTLFKETFPNKLIAAHMKTVDSGGLEADMAFRSGADFTTVLGTASDGTFEGAIAAARKHNRSIVADMILVTDRVKRAQELEAIGVHYLAIHCRLDDQFRLLCTETVELLTSLQNACSMGLIATGNINQHAIPQLKEMKVDISVFGSLIYASSSPREVVIQTRQAMNR